MLRTRLAFWPFSVASMPNAWDVRTETGEHQRIRADPRLSRDEENHGKISRMAETGKSQVGRNKQKGRCLSRDSGEDGLPRRKAREVGFFSLEKRWLSVSPRQADSKLMSFCNPRERSKLGESSEQVHGK